MAQDPVFGEASAQRPLEGVDFVDTFADEGTFAEHILVDVGDGAGIRIDTRLAPEQLRVPGPVRARQAHGHAGLKDAVPRDNALFAFVVLRTIQRVRHGSHELPRRVARELRIRVQGNHVLHVDQRCSIADNE